MYKCLLFCSVVFFTASSHANESLIPQLEKFSPFINKTWRGEFSESTPEKPVIDVSRWERHLNGTAVRIEHSLNDGAYGGETIIFWDTGAEKIRYYYFTTAGFYTTGEVEFDGKVFVSHEKVTGNADGVTDVKARAWIQGDGTLKSESQYLKNGEWVPGHSAVYREDPAAKLIFR